MQEILHGPHQILQECHGPPSNALLLNIRGGILTTPLVHLRQRKRFRCRPACTWQRAVAGKSRVEFREEEIRGFHICSLQQK